MSRAIIKHIPLEYILRFQTLTIFAYDPLCVTWIQRAKYGNVVIQQWIDIDCKKIVI